MSSEQPNEPHLLYLNKSTPEEFQNAELMDWVYLVGDISTQYELDFVRKFGHAMKSRPHPAPTQFKCPDCERTFDSDIHLGIHHYADHAIKHDAALIHKAREDVLALIKSIDIGGCPYPRCNTDAMYCRDCLLEWIVRSLRAQQAGEP
jgi:hypothetical protein